MDDAIRTVQRLVFGEAALYGGVLRRLLRDGGSIVLAAACAVQPESSRTPASKLANIFRIPCPPSEEILG